MLKKRYKIKCQKESLRIEFIHCFRCRSGSRKIQSLFELVGSGRIFFRHSFGFGSRNELAFLTKISLNTDIQHFLSKAFQKVFLQLFKGIDRPFGGGVESILIRFLLVNWRLGYFFISYFKEPSSQDQQKSFKRCLIAFKVTLTGQSHFMLIFVLRKVTLRGHINSVP
jgi:hypothetical protein